MFFKIIMKIRYVYRLLFTSIIYRQFFRSLGKHTLIESPLKIMNEKNIDIGYNVTIEKYVTLYSVEQYNRKMYAGKIKIGNNVYMNNNCNITAANSIIIHDNVVMAFNVSCFDFNHNYEDLETPVKYSDLSVLGEIIISENCWIGMNVSIIGNVHLGKNCIVGANSVVTKSFPENTVIAGIPAKIIKKYDAKRKIWKRVDTKGDYTNEI